jgi:hypothetical protein
MTGTIRLELLLTAAKEKRTHDDSPPCSSIAARHRRPRRAQRQVWEPLPNRIQAHIDFSRPWHSSCRADWEGITKWWTQSTLLLRRASEDIARLESGW